MIIRLTTTLSLVLSLTASGLAGIGDPPDDSFLWNNIYSVEVVDSFALAASDFGVAALKLNPITGTFDPVNNLILNTAPASVKVVDSMALVTGIAGLTYLVDLSELPTLSLVGELDLGSTAYDLALDGDDLYIASGFQGLRHYRLTDYGSPEFVDSSLTGVHCVQVEVDGDQLLVLDDYNGIVRYDLAGAGLAAAEDRLLLPRRGQGFFSVRDTLVIPIVNQPFLYRGISGDLGSHLVDSADLNLIPEAVYAIDTFLIALNTDRNLMEVVSTESGSQTLYDIHWNPHLDPTGCTYYENGVPHLMLTSAYDGLVSFNLENIWFTTEPRDAFGRPGPVTSVTYHNGRLMSGGAHNPLDAYLIDSTGRAVLDTTLTGRNNVGSVVSADNGLLAHFPSVGLLSAIRFDVGSIETLGSLDVSGRGIRNLKFYPFDLNDTLSVALARTADRVGVIGIAGDWTLNWITQTSEYSTELLDMVLADTVLLVTTDDGQIHSHRVYGGGSALPKNWEVSAPGPISHMVVVEEREANDGSWWYWRRVLAFSGNQMYEILIDFANYGKPSFYELDRLPIDVKASAIGYGVLYTIGDQGMGVIDLTVDQPVMIEHGGYGGHMIATDETTLATSGCSAVNLYTIAAPPVSRSSGDLFAAGSPEFLKPNYPNPFNPVTRIDFDLPRSTQVEISIYNLLGQRILKLFDGPAAAGLNSVEWDGRDQAGHRVSSGVYFYRLTTATQVESRKMILLK